MMGMSKFFLIEYQIIYCNLEINLSIYDVREPTNDYLVEHMCGLD